MMDQAHPGVQVRVWHDRFINQSIVSGEENHRCPPHRPPQRSPPGLGLTELIIRRMEFHTQNANLAFHVFPWFKSGANVNSAWWRRGFSSQINKDGCRCLQLQTKVDEKSRCLCFIQIMTLSVLICRRADFRQYLTFLKTRSLVHLKQLSHNVRRRSITDHISLINNYKNRAGRKLLSSQISGKNLSGQICT